MGAIRYGMMNHWRIDGWYPKFLTTTSVSAPESVHKMKPTIISNAAAAITRAGPANRLVELGT